MEAGVEHRKGGWISNFNNQGIMRIDYVLISVV